MGTTTESNRTETCESIKLGLGRSGFGRYGYTTDSSLTDHRSGENVIDLLSPDDEGSGSPGLRGARRLGMLAGGVAACRAMSSSHDLPVRPAIRLQMSDDPALAPIFGGVDLR